MAEDPSPRTGMPEGWNLVVHGAENHCLLSVTEQDKEGEGITARADGLELLAFVTADSHLDYVELFHGPQQRRHMGQVKIEILSDRAPGWIRAVHHDEALRALDRHISAKGSRETP